MMHTHTGLGYYQGEVEGRMEAGDSFEAVEDFINEAVPLGEMHRAALWLLAWSLRDAAAQLKDARATLGLL